MIEFKNWLHSPRNGHSVFPGVGVIETNLLHFAHPDAYKGALV